MRISAGDVFTIPCGDGRVGTGQVVSINPVSPVFVYVHERLWNLGALPALVEMCTGPLLLAANTFDALLANGHWSVVGNLKVDPVKALVPRFKVFQGGHWFVEGFGGDQIGPATTADLELLRLRNVTSPMNLEDALKAHHDLDTWREHFDALRYSRVQESGEPLAIASRRVRWN